MSGWAGSTAGESHRRAGAFLTPSVEAVQHVVGPASAPSSSLARLLVAGLTHAPLARDVMKRDPQAVHRTVRLVDRLVDLAARVKPALIDLLPAPMRFRPNRLRRRARLSRRLDALSCTLPRDPRLHSPARDAPGKHAARAGFRHLRQIIARSWPRLSFT